MHKTHGLTIDIFFILLTFAVIVIASVGILKHVAIPLGVSLTLFYLGLKLIGGFKLAYPPGFLYFSLFTFIVLGHSLYFEGKIVYFWLFFSGGLFWLAMFNVRDTARKFYFPFLVLFGALMALVSIILRLRGVNFLSPDNLFLPLQSDILHNHLGDLWAFILIAVISVKLHNPEIKYILLSLAATAIVAFSFSRSAILSVIGSLLFIYEFFPGSQIKLPAFHKRLMYFAPVILGGALIVIFSLAKPIISSRPYYFEALTSVLFSPLGIGIGNFETVSAQTNVVHNLILEVLVGLGIFSVIFIVWLFKVFNYLLLKNENLLFKAVSAGIFINFLFDSTYVIPGMLWLFFISIALT